jgi:hypothetical protein
LVAHLQFGQVLLDIYWCLNQRGAQAATESGKPTITAKNAFAVNHLHHKPPHPMGLDAGAEYVDNCGPPVARDA